MDSFNARSYKPPFGWKANRAVTEHPQIASRTTKRPPTREGRGAIRSASAQPAASRGHAAVMYSPRAAGEVLNDRDNFPYNPINVPKALLSSDARDLTVVLDYAHVLQ